jgi:hypothetical protein
VKTKGKVKALKLPVKPEATVVAIPLDRVALMTIERGFLMVRMRGSWAPGMPPPQAETQKERSGPSPAGIAAQAPDVAAILNGAPLPEEAVDQLSAISDLRKSELWSGPASSTSEETLALYSRTKRHVTLSTKTRPLDTFVTADTSPIGGLLAEIAQLEGKLMARIRKTADIYKADVKVHKFTAPVFQVQDKMYYVSEPLILWGEGSGRVDMTDLDKV